MIRERRPEAKGRGVGLYDGGAFPIGRDQPLVAAGAAILTASSLGDLFISSARMPANVPIVRGI